MIIRVMISFLTCTIAVNNARQIDSELVPIAWKWSRWWDGCMSGDKKREIKKCFNDE